MTTNALGVSGAIGPGRWPECPRVEVLGGFVSVSVFTHKNSKAVEQTQVVRMVCKGQDEE